MSGRAHITIWLDFPTSINFNYILHSGCEKRTPSRFHFQIKTFQCFTEYKEIRLTYWGMYPAGRIKGTLAWDFRALIFFMNWWCRSKSHTLKYFRNYFRFPGVIHENSIFSKKPPGNNKQYPIPGDQTISGYCYPDIFQLPSNDIRRLIIIREFMISRKRYSKIEQFLSKKRNCHLWVTFSGSWKSPGNVVRRFCNFWVTIFGNQTILGCLAK